jgi:hypothetical protein
LRDSQESLKFDIWFLLTNFNQEILEFSFGNSSRLGNVKVHEKVVKVKIMEFEGYTNFEESLINELSNFSLVEISIIIEIIGFPNVFNPLFNVIFISTNSVLNNVVGVSVFFITDISKGKTKSRCNINLVTMVSGPIVSDESIQTKENTENNDACNEPSQNL